jgi:glycosyltransferase involved in cell wall biosynthesis
LQRRIKLPCGRKTFSFGDEMRLSVIIPTYKRPLSMVKAVQSLQQQSLQNFEIIIVDNDNDPNVAKIVKDIAVSAVVPVTYVAECNLGAHLARHAGARAAKGDVLLFADDDQTFDRNWAEAYARNFDKYQDMVAAGGPIKPEWESLPPQWVSECVKGRKMFPILGLIDLYDTFQLDIKGVFFSGNMAIRRRVFFEMGGFGPDLFGERLLGNGETGLNHKIQERGMLVGYVPDAIVYHHISTARMTVEYFRQRMANEGSCDMYTRFHNTMPGNIGLLWHAISILVRNSVLWLIKPFVAGRTSWLCLQIQLQAARSRSQLRYVQRLIKDQEFREFVLKENWLNPSCTSQ